MSFTEKLGTNQRNFAEEALLRTICEDPSQTIGEIWESLESDADSEFMWDLFKKLSVGRLVTAAVRFAEAARASKPEAPTASAPEPEPDDSEVEEDVEDDEFDDDEFDDDEFDDEEVEEEDDEFDDDEEEEDPPKRQRKSKKTSKTKSSKPKAKAKAKSSKKKDGYISGISTPDGKKKYQASIIKFLKQQKARSEEKGKRSTEIREVVGGNPKQFRDNINEMIEAGSVEFAGQARGMKYFLA